MRKKLKWHLWQNLLQYKDFKTEPSEEQTEYAKWEGYEGLVLKMRKPLATLADFDGAEVGDDAEAMPVPRA